MQLDKQNQHLFHFIPILEPQTVIIIPFTNTTDLNMVSALRAVVNEQGSNLNGGDVWFSHIDPRIWRWGCTSWRGRGLELGDSWRSLGKRKINTPMNAWGLPVTNKKTKILNQFTQLKSHRRVGNGMARGNWKVVILQCICLQHTI